MRETSIKRAKQEVHRLVVCQACIKEREAGKIKGNHSRKNNSHLLYQNQTLEKEFSKQYTTKNLFTLLIT